MHEIPVVAMFAFTLSICNCDKEHFMQMYGAKTFSDRAPLMQKKCTGNVFYGNVW